MRHELMIGEEIDLGKTWAYGHEGNQLDCGIDAQGTGQRKDEQIAKLGSADHLGSMNDDNGRQQAPRQCPRTSKVTNI